MSDQEAVVDSRRSAPPGPGLRGGVVLHLPGRRPARERRSSARRARAEHPSPRPDHVPLPAARPRCARGDRRSHRRLRASDRRRSSRHPTSPRARRTTSQRRRAPTAAHTSVRRQAIASPRPIVADRCSIDSATRSTRRPQPALHVRDLRQGRVEPVRARRRAPRRRDAGRCYNPLFIYGAAGLGKTHLLHAIGHYVHHHYQHDEVRYVSTETFLNEYVDAIRTNTMASFKRRYRDIDVLLDRRHPVHGGQGRSPGGVLPHVQLAARREQADRHLAATACPTRSRRSKNASAAGSSGA